MKDYKLSEIKAICDKYNGRCELCAFIEFGWVDYGDTIPCPFLQKPKHWKVEEKKDDN